MKTGDEVAIKFERVSKSENAPLQLLYESRLYSCLQGGTGIPSTHYFGSYGNYNVLVMEKLGPSLEKLFRKCNQHFSLKTVLMLADQMISRIQWIHECGFVHRDIKPDNFCIGIGRRAPIISIIDLGLAKRYMDPQTRKHIMYREGKRLTGTARYASVNTHLGIEQSRRDDLEGLAYVLLYFLRQPLPWQNLGDEQLILTKKMSTPVSDLCRGLPPEFASFLQYTRALCFDEAPDYDLIRRMFRDLFVREGYSLDYMYDWVISSNNDCQVTIVAPAFYTIHEFILLHHTISSSLALILFILLLLHNDASKLTQTN